MKRRRRRNINLRIFIISVLVALLFITVSANVFIVSVLGYHINSKTDIKQEIEGIHQVNNTLTAQRGSIVDRNGAIIAQNVTAYTLYAIIDPDRIAGNGAIAYVNDKEDAAMKLSTVLDLSYEEVFAYLDYDGTQVKQVEFGYAGKYLSLQEKETIEAFAIPGIGFTVIVARSYPLKRFASNLIGYSQYDEYEKLQVGKLGIELSYDAYLRGENGFEIYEQDLDGYILPQNEVIQLEPVNGSTIKLTLDRGIQESLETALGQLTSGSSVNASSTWGAVVEVDTGKIIAWGENPSFDPNLLDIEDWTNKGSQWTYEPGSTMKTFTVATAIDQGVYNGSDTFDSGAFYVGIRNGVAYRQANSTNAIATITNALNIDYGYITFDRGYALSSNVMIAQLLTSVLDPEIYHDYLLELGFYQLVDTDKIPEEAGIDLWNWPLEKINNGFGQGSTVTMLQLLQAYTAIFTDGTTRKPYYIDEIIDPQTSEVVYKGKTTLGSSVFAESTVAQVRDLMRSVVSGGTATRYDIDEIEVIGKTGTAELVIDGVYSKEYYVYSSILGFPYDDPQYMVYIAYVAHRSHSLNESAAAINDVVKKTVLTYGLNSISNSEVVESTTVNELKNYVNYPLAEAKADLETLGYNPVIIGSGSTVINQYPAFNTKTLSNEKILLVTSTSDIQMPDMQGWSKKEVTAFWSMTGIYIEILGDGFVIEQSIEPETVINKESVITLKLE